MKSETYLKKLNDASSDLDTLYIARSDFLRRRPLVTFEAIRAFEAIEKSIKSLEADIARYEKFALLATKRSDTEIATERERLVIWHESDSDYDWRNDKNDYDTEAHKYDAKPIAIAPVEPTALILDDHQKYLVSLLANPNISEASTDDDGAYSISVKVNGAWEKKFWTNSEVQQLVDAGYLCKFPNRWNPKHDVVIIAKDRQTELFALAKKHAS